MYEKINSLQDLNIVLEEILPLYPILPIFESF